MRKTRRAFACVSRFPLQTNGGARAMNRHTSTGSEIRLTQETLYMYMASLPMRDIMMLSATFWTARPTTFAGPMVQALMKDVRWGLW